MLGKGLHSSRAQVCIRAVQQTLEAGRIAYVHVIRGRVTANRVQLTTGDALKLVAEDAVSLKDADAAEVLLFDLPQ